MWFLVVGIFACSASLNDAQYLLGLAEGEVCSDRSEGQWICTAHKQCTHVDLKVMRPTICSFKGKLPIICCPPKKKMSKAEMSCLKHTELCKGTGMFRTASGRSLPGKPLEWTADEDNDAEVLEVPSESSTTSNDSETTPSTATSLESVEATSPMTTDTNHTTGGDIPKIRQFVMGGHYSLPRIHRHMALIGYGPKITSTGDVEEALSANFGYSALPTAPTQRTLVQPRGLASVNSTIRRTTTTPVLRTNESCSGSTTRSTKSPSSTTISLSTNWSLAFSLISTSRRFAFTPLLTSTNPKERWLDGGERILPMM
uniref:Proclotting enzyme n=1 Tax=Lygus hesperus TaxID=30085 RepID=A0A0A9YZ65_LYGHE